MNLQPVKQFGHLVRTMDQGTSAKSYESNNPAGCFRYIQARGEDGVEPGHVRGINLPSSPGVPCRRRWPGLENVAPSAQIRSIMEMNMGILSFSINLSWISTETGHKTKTQYDSALYKTLSGDDRLDALSAGASNYYQIMAMFVMLLQYILITYVL